MLVDTSVVPIVSLASTLPCGRTFLRQTHTLVSRARRQPCCLSRSVHPWHALDDGYAPIHGCPGRWRGGRWPPRQRHRAGDWLPVPHRRRLLPHRRDRPHVCPLPHGAAHGHGNGRQEHLLLRLGDRLHRTPRAHLRARHSSGVSVHQFVLTALRRSSPAPSRSVASRAVPSTRRLVSSPSSRAARPRRR